MPKNCVITLDPELVDKAASNAHKLGKSLKEVIEDAITTTAEATTDGPWITEKELEKLPWAPSRVSLYQMRRSGRLIPGKHYKSQGRFVFYEKTALEKELSTYKGKKEAAEPGLTETKEIVLQTL